ncbi:MAG: hypothetical protein JRG97_17240, partial [Deltaproteobacteria bacterium]|nr:hypothetical protein [Deltaproteobacteria bacterium]
MIINRKIIFCLFLGFVLVSISAVGFVPASQAKNDTDETLKIALLPILDAFPFYVAQEEGYFKE